MNCSQCGAPIEKGLRFCTQCGARIQLQDITREIPQYLRDDVQEDFRDIVYQQPVDDMDYAEGTIRDRDISRPVAKSTPRKETNQAPAVGYYMDNNRQLGPGRRYQWEGRTGINGFAETLLAIIVDPVVSGEELFLRLDKKITMLYTAAIILITSCVSYLMYAALASKVARLFYNAFDYFFGYGTIQYFLEEVNIQIFLMAILSNVLIIGYVTLLVLGLYKVILKIDIEWIECIQLMMMPLVIGFFGKVLILIVGFISIKLALLLGGMLVILIAVLAVVQFINRLGLSALTVYSMPPIYVLCGVARMAVLYQIIKGYL